MKIIGVTGNIGSGKSLFCSYLKDAGAWIFNADYEAKQIMVQDEAVKKQIIDAFGQQSYLEDGQLNRKWLSDQAFSSGKADILNQIVHPAVIEETKRQVEVARQSGCPLFVKEAALLLNNGRNEILDYVIWIQSPLQTRIERVQVRDNADINDILARDEKQLKLADVAVFIDEIVINDGTREELKKKAARVLEKLTSM